MEKALYCHGIIQSKDLNQYCFVPGGCATTEYPSIICFMDLHLVDKVTSQITHKIKIYPSSSIGLNNFSFYAKPIMPIHTAG